MSSRLLAEVAFHRLLEERRRELGYGQRGLAARAGLSDAAISLLETGRRTPTLSTLVKLAPALRLRFVVEPDGTIRGERP